MSLRGQESSVIAIRGLAFFSTRLHYSTRFFFCSFDESHVNGVKRFQKGKETVYTNVSQRTNLSLSLLNEDPNTLYQDNKNRHNK